MVINTALIELTNKCDLDCKFCPRKDINDLDFEFFKFMIEENKKLETPIKFFELGGMGNPLLYNKIREVLELLRYNNIKSTIITNGLNLKDIISYFDDDILSGISFCLYLDSPAEEKNNYLMGKKVFNKTLESMEYLLSRNLIYNIFMRICSQNYREIEEMLEISNHYKSRLLVPMEVFPIGKGRDWNSLLKDDARYYVVETINKMKDFCQPIFKNIHFESPEVNCSYLRKERIFINSKGKLSFCHFLSSLNGTEVDIRNRGLEEIININNELHDKFLRKKEETLKDLMGEERIISPCRYCTYCYGIKQW